MRAGNRVARWPRILVLVAFAGAGALTSAQLRHRQARIIERERAEAFEPGMPIVTQPDAFLWLRYAREHASGSYEPVDTLRRPPDSPRRPPVVPLLSRMIAGLSLVTGSELHTAGNVLAIVLPGLFAIPIALLGWMLRRPAMGLLGGLVGAVAVGYFTRTDVGSIDTDLLNLFFPALAALLLLLVQRADTATRRLVAVVALGLTMRAFYLWYAKAGFCLLYGLLLAVALWGARIGLVGGIANLAAYVLAAGPGIVFAAPDSLARFVRGYLGAGDPVRPTITELAAPAGADVLQQVFSWEAATAAGLLAFAAWAVRHPRPAAYLSPLWILGAASLVGGIRFAMYLGPIVGMGLGFVVDVGVGRAFAGRESWRLAATAVASVAIFLGLLRFTPVGKTPHGPCVPGATYRAIEAVADHTEPGALVFVWWDYGFAVQHAADRPTYIDGGAPGLPRTPRFAEALTSPDPQRLAETMDELGGRPAYALLTADLVDKYGALARLASKPRRGYASVTCAPEGPRIICGGATMIDLHSNHVRAPELGRVVVVEDGSVVIDRELAPRGDVLQVVLHGGAVIAAHRVAPTAFASTFNQLFWLGASTTAFEEVMHVPGAARLLRRS